MTLGGASVGDFDLVQKTALGHGLALDFYRVAMRPGKPLMAGRLGGVPLVGLPGNPVSAMVSGRLFLVAGRRADARPARRAARHAAGPARAAPWGRTARAPTTCGRGSSPSAAGWRCTPFARQDSSLLSVLAEANALMLRPPHDPARPAGDAVEFIWL